MQTLGNDRLAMPGRAATDEPKRVLSLPGSKLQESLGGCAARRGLTSIGLMDGLENGGGGSKAAATHPPAKQGFDGGHHGRCPLWSSLPPPLPRHWH